MKKLILILAIIQTGACVHAQTNLTAPVSILPMPAHDNPGPLLWYDKSKAFAVGLQAPASGISSSTITAATAANPMVLTLNVPPPAYVQTGTEIVIVGALGAGCNGMNGVHPVTTLAGTSVTVAYNNTGCTYTASSGTVGLIFTLPPSDGQNALCGNANSTLSFSCSQVIVSVAALATNLTALGLSITDSAVLYVDLVQIPGSGGRLLMKNSSGTTVSTVDYLGISTTGSLTVSSIGGSTQCIHVNSGGLFSGTGGDCAVAPGVWNSWSPGYSNLTSVSTFAATYSQFSKTVSYAIQFSATTTSSSPSFSLPLNVAAGPNTIFECALTGGALVASANGLGLSGSGIVVINQFNAAAWSAGSTLTFYCSGTYQTP